MSESAPWVLAIDASMPPSSVALAHGLSLAAAAVGPFGRGADAWVIAAVDRVLRQAGLQAAELDAVVACTGPGTFTGIRVGLAAALGIGRGADVVVGGIGTLEALAHSARAAAATPGPVLACNDARRGEVYALLASDSDAGPVWGPEALAPAELIRRLQPLGRPPAAGTGLAIVDRLTELVTPVETEPGLAVAAAALAATRLQQPADARLGEPTPLYLRPADALPGVNPLTRARRRG